MAINSPPSRVEKPLVFISCGQYTQEEIALGKALEQMIKTSTPYDAYFAEVQNSLEGLSTNILASLQRCVAFVAVAHHRGLVQRPDGQSLRASVWVEQEIAIAAFIQHALQRKIEVALYLQRGIRREGIREQLRLAPVEFETSEQVIEDFRQRLSRWNLDQVPTHALVAEWTFKAERMSQDHHDYRLFIDLVNEGDKLVKDWRLRVEIPREFVAVGQGDSDVVVIEEDSANLPPDEAKIYPRSKKQDVQPVRYFVDCKNYDTIRPETPIVTLTVLSGDAEPWVKSIPLSQLNNF